MFNLHSSDSRKIKGLINYARCKLDTFIVNHVLSDGTLIMEFETHRFAIALPNEERDVYCVEITDRFNLSGKFEYIETKELYDVKQILKQFSEKPNPYLGSGSNGIH